MDNLFLLKDFFSLVLLDMNKYEGQTNGNLIKVVNFKINNYKQIITVIISYSDYFIVHRYVHAYTDTATIKFR